MAGMANRKENLPDHSLSIPLKRPKEMVMPEREIPGMRAKPWPSPTMRVSITPILSIPLESDDLPLVNHKIVPVTINMKPATSGEAKRWEKISSKKNPISAAGTDPTMIKRTNLP